MAKKKMQQQQAQQAQQAQQQQQQQEAPAMAFTQSTGTQEEKGTNRQP